MEEYVNLKAVLEIVAKYCPDDDGTCSKLGADLRELLDEIEALDTLNISEDVNNLIYRDKIIEELDQCRKFKIPVCEFDNGRCQGLSEALTRVRLIPNITSNRWGVNHK